MKIKHLFLITFFSVAFWQTANAQVIYPPDSAGISTTYPGFTYGSNGKDIVNGTPYYYVQNDLSFTAVSTVAVTNNNNGALHRGAVIDFVYKPTGRENLDWTQFLLHTSMHDGWNFPAQNFNLSNITVGTDTASVIAEGPWNTNSNISARAIYRTLPGAPILKITVTLFNTGALDFNGYFEYQNDPDESGEQKAYVPGMGWGTSLVTSGWSDNFVYNGVGPGLTSTKPAHGIAWFGSQPTGIVSPGYIFGVWFSANIPAGDSVSFDFYHISNIPSAAYTNNYDCISHWAHQIPLIDPAYANYSQITGLVENTGGVALHGIKIRSKNIQAQEVGRTFTDQEGKYSFFLPKDVYTMTATGLGYKDRSRSIDSNVDSVLEFTNAFYAALEPVSVWAGKGKTIPGSLVQGTEDDFLMENIKISLSIADVSSDGQLPLETRGRILDLAVKGLNDDLDWMKFPLLSESDPLGTEAWAVQSVLYDTVFVSELSESVAKITATGRFFNADSTFNNMTVSTVFTIEPGNEYVEVCTEIKNDMQTGKSLWIGDVIDWDGSGQTSYVPGYGHIYEPYENPAQYDPAEPWICQYGSSEQAYGVIYTGDYALDFKAYGTRNWIMTKKYVTIDAGQKFMFTRYMVAASTLGMPEKPDAVHNLFLELNSGITLDLLLSAKILSLGDTLSAYVTLHNISDVTLDNSIILTYNLPGFLSSAFAADTLPLVVLDSLPAKSDTTFIWRFTATGGGRGTIGFTAAFQDTLTISKDDHVFVDGPGWFAGDNHSHTIYSDGTGTVAQNVASAYQKGLSFLTTTDHNTINQKTDVEIEDAKYPDFVALWGEEVTTSNGHFLAYNIANLIPWSLSQYTHQQMIDITEADNSGQGMAFIAHPYYPGLQWPTWSITGYTGIEVWNGFYSGEHSVNALAREKWDDLNAAGMHLTGIANSDAHNPGKIGDPRIVAYLNRLHKAEIIHAIKTGRFYGTNGPELEFTVNDAMMGEDLAIASLTADVNIHVEVAYILGIEEVKLIRNGAVEMSWTPMLPGFSADIIISVHQGDFLRVEVSGGEGFAFSNPVWIVGNPAGLREVQAKGQDEKWHKSANDAFVEGQPRTGVNKCLVYPNPARDEVNVVFTGNLENFRAEIRILTLLGDEVLRMEAEHAIESVNVENLLPGLYLVMIRHNDIVIVEKLMVE